MRHPALFLLLALGACAQAPRQPFSVVKATIPHMQEALATGAVTSRELVQQYLVRIATYDKKLNAVMTVNPRALGEAEALDRERQRGTIRGPLHGIPIAIKDNIQTIDMPTTGGALAFEGFVPPYEATVVKSLRDAGAIALQSAEQADLEADRARYDADRAKDVGLSGAHGIDEIMRAARLDAILFPIGSGAILSARPGYPTVIVPFALVANAPTPPFPQGFNARPTPFGVSFAGGACSEPRLIGIAYAFEQATRRRVPPPLFP